MYTLTICAIQITGSFQACVTAEQREKSINFFLIDRGQGDNGKAIYELTKYLKVFMSDQEAWLELCDLYIMVSF